MLSERQNTNVIRNLYWYNWYDDITIFYILLHRVMIQAYLNCPGYSTMTPHVTWRSLSHHSADVLNKQSYEWEKTMSIHLTVHIFKLFYKYSIRE